MVALGQKQTFAVQKGMSALPPESDAECVHSNVRYGPIAHALHQLSISRRRVRAPSAGHLDRAL